MLLYLELFYVVIVFCAAIVRNKNYLLDPSIKTYTDAILQIRLICRYICRRSILLYVYVYELCTHSCV